MNRLRTLLTLLLCTLLMGAGLPRTAGAMCSPGNPGPARSCCGEVCHCTPEALAQECPCSKRDQAPPRTPAPDAPRCPQAPAEPRPEPVPVTCGECAAFAARTDYTPRFGIDARQGRARHSVLSVWLI